jgi:hypothetical protein
MNAAGPLWIVASVVAIAGVWKLWSPAAAARALAALVGPHRGLGLISRAMGGGELAVAGAAAWYGGHRWPLGLAALFLAVAAVAARLRGRAVSCGCFGAASSRASGLHIAVNLLCAAVALGAALAGPLPLRDARELPYAGVAHVLLVPAGAAAVIALLTVLPAVRELGSQSPAQPVLFRLRSER